MDFTCSWRNSQVPSIVNDAVTYADTGLPASHWLSSLGANRFFTEARLQGQDTVIPLLSNPGLTATAQELIAPVVLYDYDSSLTGGMLIIGGMMPNIMADDAVQARLLPRNYLQYFAAGIDGVFCYSITDSNAAAQNPMNVVYNLGIAENDMTPKTSYPYFQATAQFTMGSAFKAYYQTPEGIHIICLQNNSGYVYAVWQPIGGSPMPSEVQQVSSAYYDATGTPISIPLGSTIIGPDVVWTTASAPLNVPGNWTLIADNP